MLSDKVHKRHLREFESGIALVTLLFFTLIATIYISAAIIVMAVNTSAATTTEYGMRAARLSEGVLEDTLLRLLRNPDYAGGTFNIDGGNATVNITGDGTKDVIVTLETDNYTRKYMSQVMFVELSMTVLSWNEEF
jgi:hypothetical protein